MYNLSQGYGVGTGASPPAYFQQESRLEYIAHAEASYSSSAPSPHAVASYAPPALGGRFPYSEISAGISGAGIPYNLFSSLGNSANAGYNAAGQGGAGYAPNQTQYSFHIIQPEYHFDPALFLRPGKEGGFVGKAEEVREFVETAFEKIFQAPFPNDIKISVLPTEEFRKLAPQPGVIGLSLNRKKEGLLNEIFILNDSLARVMLTIGHELGHVLTETLNNPHDEEAKAYAFSLEWMQVIKKNDIAGLGEAIVTERPAENGLHDVAFRFVERLLREGTKARKVYQELVQGLLRCPVNQAFVEG